MRIVFMGTPDFAVPTLQRLIDKHEVLGVFTQPDKPRGRHMTLTPSDVKVCALQNGIPVYQPESLKHGEAMPILDELKPDVIVVAAYGQILKEDVLKYPKYGCINAHGSLLPKYRGAAPIQRAVLDGEKYAGVTAMQMDVGLDTGDMLLAKSVEIGENETAGELFDRLALLAADVIEETLDNIDSLQPEAQDDSLSTYAKMLSKAECPIDWKRSAFQIHKQICGLNPWPSATAEQGENLFKIHMSHITDRTSDKAPGTIIDSKYVVCGDGKLLELVEIQATGAKRMNIHDYLLGHKLEGVFD